MIRRMFRATVNHAEDVFRLPLAPPPANKQTVHQATRSFAGKLFQEFLDFPIDVALQLIKEKPEEYWLKAGEARALALFQEAASRVPAYQKFLKENGVDPRSVKSIEDFKKVPWTDKKNYLSKYSLQELSWDGVLSTSQMVSVSSGSSGVPFYWPRGSLLEMETSYVQETYLKDVFQVDQYKTLYVDAFAMGMYIAGPIILNTALRVAQKGYPMTIITPGLELPDVIRATADLAEHFDQIVLAGYPPFLKDIVDEGIRQDFDWSKYHTRFLLAGEGFNESWREYVAHLVGGANVITDFINIYGTADASIIGHETPTSIAIRRHAASDHAVFAKLFPEERNHRLPTFVQYYPTLKYFEEIDSEIIFTATAGIPLVRYNIHDWGGVVSYEQALKAVGLDDQGLGSELSKQRDDLHPWYLPFVYLYGKSDFTVTLYGLNIYPENIKLALEDPHIRSEITGRFNMSTEYHAKTNNQYLLVNIELQQGRSGDKGLTREIVNSIVGTLRRVNVEYNKLYTSIGAGKSEPVVKLYPYNDPEHFKRGIKQRWA